MTSSTCFFLLLLLLLLFLVLFPPLQIIETVLLTQPNAHTNWIKLLCIVGYINKSSVLVLSLGLILGSGGQLHCTVLCAYVRS